MRLLALSTAVLALLTAAPALASGPRGGPGGGHPPAPSGPCCGHGGGSTNVNVNINAQASAAASARSYLNARAYEVGSVRGGAWYGGSVYVGGGYGGDVGGYGGGYGYVGAPIYHDLDPRAVACASAPFGYVVTGFGRDGRRPPSCGDHEDYRHGEDRGGRYGYSERHASYEESRYESRERSAEYEVYEAYEARETYEASGGYETRRDCDCRAPAPYPPAYLPEPPRREVSRPEPHSYPRPYEPRPAPPRQEYRQEPGERG